MNKQKSLRQLARELQISPAYLSMLMRAQRSPNTQLRDKFCSLGVLTSETKIGWGSKHSTAGLHSPEIVSILALNSVALKRECLLAILFPPKTNPTLKVDNSNTEVLLFSLRDNGSASKIKPEPQGLEVIKLYS
ncbi:hypothetical protein ACFLUQ_01355 [Chloroflexota bacterium]